MATIQRSRNTISAMLRSWRRAQAFTAVQGMANGLPVTIMPPIGTAYPAGAQNRDESSLCQHRQIQ
ncbi:hypothetical protein [Acetobacter senegalensis]